MDKEQTAEGQATISLIWLWETLRTSPWATTSRTSSSSTLVRLTRPLVHSNPRLSLSPSCINNRTQVASSTKVEGRIAMSKIH